MPYARDVTLPPQIQVSDLDSKRFSIKAERLTITNEEQISDGKIVELCREMSGDLLILRAPSSRVTLGARLLGLEQIDVFQADTLVYFTKTLDDVNSRFGATHDVVIRNSMPSDMEHVGSVAREAFESYPNHYLANPHLEPTAIAQGYGEWAESCVADPRMTVLVAVGDESVCGFIATKINNQRAEVVLNAVIPSFQGRGIYQNLLQRTCNLVFEGGGSSISISTQVSNHRVINTWIRSGFVLTETFNTFHLRKNR